MIFQNAKRESPLKPPCARMHVRLCMAVCVNSYFCENELQAWRMGMRSLNPLFAGVRDTSPLTPHKAVLKGSLASQHASLYTLNKGNYKIKVFLTNGQILMDTSSYRMLRTWMHLQRMPDRGKYRN